MISFSLGKHTYKIPNAWDELTQRQYLLLVPLLDKMTSGALSLCQVRVKWLLAIMHLERIRIRPDQADVFTDNLYTLSRQITFFWYVDYGEAAIDLAPDVRKLVRKLPAEDVVSTNPELRYLQRIDYSIRLDAVWAKNLIPAIDAGCREYSGWDARIEAEMLTTTMTTRQFTQGYDLLLSIGNGYARSSMLLLTALLYGIDAHGEDSGDLELLDDDLLQAIVLNFQAFVSFIFTKTHFSVLWNRDLPAKPNRKVSMSMSEGVYALCNKGYGNYDQVENMPLMTYLSILRADLISSVRSMHDTGSAPEKIAEQTGMPYDLIIQMI